MGPGPATAHRQEETCDDAATAVGGPVAPIHLDDFVHDWYIRVRFQVRDDKGVDRASEIAKMESDVLSLIEGLQSALPEHGIKLWPGRLVDATGNANTCYWVLGLPSIPSPDLAVAKQHLREWHGRASTQNSPTGSEIQAKFIPRTVFLKLALSPAEDEEKPEESRRSGHMFKKIPGSNPHQIRRQFLQHVMGSDESERQSTEPSAKLRPAKDILKKLKHDPAFDPKNFVVGYIDRKAGILEKAVTAWESFQQEDIIAYFRQVSEDRIVWDRTKKIDRLTAAL